MERMEHKLEYRLASLLYNHAFPLYRTLYQRFKLRQDASEVEFLRSVVRPGQVVVDIGSNVGFYADLMRGLVGTSGRVHCFEPDARNFAHLQDALKDAPNVVLNHAAVGATSGTVELFTSHRLNVDHRTYEPAHYHSSHRVRSIAIDDYFTADNQVHFIKMDIQGAEVSALRGMRRTLATSPQIVVMTELWPHGLQNAGGSADELLSLMQEAGFTSSLLSAGGAVGLTREDARSLSTAERDFYNVAFRR